MTKSLVQSHEIDDFVTMPHRLWLGEGLFETMTFCDGQIDYCKAHWQRLSHAADALSIPFQMSMDTWQNQLITYLERQDIREGVVKAMLIPMSQARGLQSQAKESRLYCQVFPKPVLPKSVTMMSLPWLRDVNNPIYRYKSLSYHENIHARNLVHAKGFDDGVFFDLNQFALEATSSNLFIICHGEIQTPALSLGILPGVMRQIVIQRAKACGVNVKESTGLTRTELMQAEAMFLTNSIQGIVPVEKWDEHRLSVEHRFYQLLKR